VCVTPQVLAEQLPHLELLARGREVGAGDATREVTDLRGQFCRPSHVILAAAGESELRQIFLDRDELLFE